MHTSFVYQIANGVLLPQNPLIGGEDLLYPWGSHLLVALISQFLKITPSSSFALLNIVSLLLTMVLVFKTAYLLFYSRLAAIFAVFLSIFGVTFFSRGDVAKFFSYLTNLAISEPRAVIGIKFTNMNTMPLGILFFALFIYSLISIFSKEEYLNRNYISLFFAVLGAGFFYPLLWLGQIVSCLFLCGSIYLQQRQLAKQKIIVTLLSIFAATLVLSPYIYSISAAKSGSSIALTYGWKSLLTKIVNYFFTLLPLTVVFLCQPKAILVLGQNKKKANTAIAILVATALMYIFLTITPPHHNEYKYLMASSLTWGIVASIAMESLYQENRFICFLLVMILLLPISDDWLRKLNFNNWQISEPYIEQGMYLLHKDKKENHLYEWISNKTQKDAIFLDNKLTIPVFGRRQLYIGLDNSLQEKSSGFKDGWRMSIEELLSIQKYSPRLLKRRKNLAKQIYTPLNSEISLETTNQLKETSKDKDVYVVARQPKISQKLAENKAFKQVFTNEETDIYQLRKN
ncbi:MAG: hypothetical protein WA865_09240 [Spirulinaceae cyanobacterium]